jgi:hypothetical protein
MLGACQAEPGFVPRCGSVENTTLVLVAQSVPSATRLPCVDSFPAGWHPVGSSSAHGNTTFWLDSDIAGFRAVEVKLTAACDTSNATRIDPAPDEAGAIVYGEVMSQEPFRSKRFIRFEGGCVTYTYSFGAGAPARLALEADEALSFLPRAQVVGYVRDELHQTVCGASAPSCLR